MSDVETLWAASKPVSCNGLTALCERCSTTYGRLHEATGQILCWSHFLIVLGRPT